MISDRDVYSEGSKRVPLAEGSILVTRTRGQTPEMVLVERVLERGVGMINLLDGRPFTASLDSLARGRVGRSEVVGGVGRNVDVDSEGGDRKAESELGTDMVIVTSKGAGEEGILTIVSGTDSGSTVLSTPERPDRQMLRVPTEDLKKGESDSLQFTLVPSKFSLLKVAHELNGLVASQKSFVEQEPMIPCPGGVISRDVEAAEVIGGSLPVRTIDEVLEHPNKVFLEGMRRAAVRMVKDGDARHLVVLLALGSGVLAKLPILNRGD